VSDLSHTILAYTRCVEVPDETWQTNIVQGRLERNMIFQDREVSTVHSTSAEERRPVLVNDDYLPYPRIIKTLVHRGQPAGVMVVTSYLRPFQPGDMELIDLISSFVIPKLAEERYHLSPDRNSVENYFIRLLEGANYSRDRIQKRLDILGFHPGDHLYVLSLCTGHNDVPQQHAGPGELTRMLNTLGCTAFMYNAAMICLYGAQEDISDWDVQVPELSAFLKQENLLAGVSREVKAIEDFREYYRQAQCALELGYRLGRLERFFHYDNLSSFALFQGVDREQLSLYCHQRIRELAEYDEAHDTDLCVTLQVYLEQAKSLARTAEILFIHRNTIRYRIKKCMEFTNSSLEDGNEIFAFILSLRIMEFVRKFPAHEAGSTPELL